MIKKTFKLTVLFLACLLVSMTNSSFADGENNSSSGSISELKVQIDNLNKNKESLINQLDDLNKDNKLRSFFRNDLVDTDLDRIKFLISSYVVNRSALNKELILKSRTLENANQEKDNLLLLKKNLYKALIVYIDDEKLDGYIEYIENDIKLLKERKDVVEEITQKKEVLSNRVTTIETKIIDHRDSLSMELREIIEDKVDQKINLINSSKTFSELDVDSKKRVLQKTIVKIRVKIGSFEKTKEKTDILRKRLEVYKIVLYRMIEFRENIK